MVVEASTPPSTQQQPRNRTTSAASNDGQATPSRISRLFSFGSHSSPAAASRTDASMHQDGSSDLHVPGEPGSPCSAASGGHPTISHMYQHGQPSSPTPPARGNSQTGRYAVANGSLTTPLRRNSKTPFLSSMLAGNSAASADPSEIHSGGKGEDLSMSKRPETLPRPANGESSTSWRLPWTSPRRKTDLQSLDAMPAEQQAHSFGSVGLTMNGDVEETEAVGLAPTESNTSSGDVVDEGISMSDTSGKVDFLTSLPLELALYILLFSDVQTTSRAMQVSPTWHAIASDALIWRDYFYRNPGWEIRADILETGYMNGMGPEDSPITEEATPSKLQTSSQSRSRRSTTVTSDSSIAARIGRRISSIVSDISFLTLQTDRNNALDTQQDDGPAAAVAQPEEGITAGAPDAIDRPRSRSNSRAVTPSRTRSSTATSSAATHPSNFYTPLRSSLRQQPAPTGPTPSRRGSRSVSIVQSLLETHGSPNIHGIPLGPQIMRENDDTHQHFASPAHAATDNMATPPALVRSDDVKLTARRRHTTGTFSPYQSLMSPTQEFERNASLFLDWKGLYRDRLELERRWHDGRFTNRILKGHSDSVYCISMKGDMLISGARDQTIKVWNAKTGVLKRTVEAHTASVLAIQYDGKIMVTGASNGEMFVWDATTWEVTDILEGHTMGVLDVQMNDKWIVSCSKDTSIRVWKRDTKEAYRVLQGHRGPVNAIQLHDDKICSASGDSLAKLWSIESGQAIRVFKGHERGLACVQYDGDLLATGSNDKTIRIWDPNTGECTKVLKGHKDLVRTLSYDPIRKRLFSGSYDKTTRLWDVESGDLKMTFKTSHKSLVFDVTMDVSRLVSCSHDQRIVIIDFGEELRAHRFV